MSLLSQVTKGKVVKPLFILNYGVDGVGKSTFAAGAPGVIFLGTEKGTSNLDVARFPTPNNFKEVLQAVDELTKEKHEYQTLAVDSLDWLEAMVWEQTCVNGNVANIEDFGYGKGYVLANALWRDFVGRLSKLRETRNMNIILIAHSQIRLSKDPQTQTEYDRYQLKLNEKAGALWREAVDAVLFMNYEVHTKTEKGKTKAFGEGTRYIYTERRPGFDAKNRYGLDYQIEISAEDPFGDFMKAYVSTNGSDVEFHLKEIKTMLDESVKDEELKKKVQSAVELANKNPDTIGRIYNKLRTVSSQGGSNELQA